MSSNTPESSIDLFAIFYIVVPLLIAWLGNATYQWFIAHRLEILRGSLAEKAKRKRLYDKLKVIAKVRRYQSGGTEGFVVDVIADSDVLHRRYTTSFVTYFLGGLTTLYGSILLDEKLGEGWTFTDLFHLFPNLPSGATFLLIGIGTTILGLVFFIENVRQRAEFLRFAKYTRRINSKGGVRNAFPELVGIDVKELGFSEEDIF